MFIKNSSHVCGCKIRHKIQSHDHKLRVLTKSPCGDNGSCFSVGFLLPPCDGGKPMCWSGAWVGVNFTCIGTETHCSDIHIRVYKRAFREKRGGNSYFGFLRKPKVRYFSQVRIRSSDFKLHDMHHKNLGLNPAVSWRHSYNSLHH
jgi:hypothetical protein